MGIIECTPQESAMFDVLTIIELQASPTNVWAALEGFADYAKWHPMLSLRGRAVAASTLEYSYKIRASSSTYITLVGDVTESVKPVRLGWRLGSRRLFEIEESFELTPAPVGTIMRHRTTCSGLLAATIGIFAKRRVQANMKLFDRLLSEAVAGRGAQSPSISSHPGGRRKAKDKRRRRKRRAT